MTTRAPRASGSRSGAPPRRVRGLARNPAEARRKLVEAAIALFGRKGFSATSTEEVAEMAGYGQATVFFHFKTKAGLLEACFEHTLSQAQAAVAPTSGSGTLDFVRRLDQAFEDARLADFFASMMSEFATHATYGPIYAAFHIHLRGVIEAELTRETNASPERCGRAAAAIMSMLVGVHAEHRIAPGRFDRAAFSAMLVSVVQFIIADLRSKAG